MISHEENISEGWEVRSLIDIATLQRGYDLPNQQRVSGQFPVIGSNGIVGYHSAYKQKGPGVIIGRSGTLGNVYYTEHDYWPLNTSLYVKEFHGNFPKYIYFFFQSLNIEKYFAGTGVPTLNRNLLHPVKYAIPQHAEQKKIAEILSTADEAIAKVDEAIRKTERLKKGLMHELLTNGIGHKAFKETEIGKIPKEWEVAQSVEVAEINREAVDPIRAFPNSKFLYIDIDSVENGTGVIRTPKEVIGEKAPSRARRVIHRDDVLMSTVRPYLKAFAIVPKEFDGAICSTGFAVLTCKAELAPRYLLHTIFSRAVIDQCNKMMVGGQYPALSGSQVGKIKLPIPPLPEQRKIAEILTAIDERLKLLGNKKKRFERIKQGLINDLLTRRKRIKLEA